MTGGDGDGREPGRDRPTDDAATDRAATADAPTPADGEREHCAFTEEETEAVTTVANWYAAWCRSVGREPPPDRMRCILAIAVEVFMGECARQEQARRDAMGDDGEPDKIVMQ